MNDFIPFMIINRLLVSLNNLKDILRKQMVGLTHAVTQRYSNSRPTDYKSVALTANIGFFWLIFWFLDIFMHHLTQVVLPLPRIGHRGYTRSIFLAYAADVVLTTTF